MPNAHDVANLYVIDGGVFVTAGSANPTATIMANALRVCRAHDRRRVPTSRCRR